MRTSLLVLPLVAAVLAAGPARAADAPDREPASEPGLVAAELALGFVGTSLAAGAAAVTVKDAGFLSPILVLGGPMATGAIVCGIGSRSRDFDGRCGSAMLGAYAGALALLPLAYVGFAVSTEVDNGGVGKIQGMLIGAAIGYVVGATVGAVVGWNVSRTPKAARHLDVARLAYRF